jgi:ACS family glucarate transporter-like MFS transporter
MIRWALIGWMFVISAVAYLDRVNISIAGQFLQRDYHLDNTQLGAVFSAFVLGYALSQAPGGRLADRFGPRIVVAIGTVWWGVFTALTGSIPAGIARALGILIAIRFTLGVGEAVVYPASNALVSAWIPWRERGIANGWIFAGVGAGAGIAPPLITAILLSRGWRWSFWVSALIGLAAGAVWLAIARDRPDQHSWIRPAEVRHIRAGLLESNVAGRLSWRTILRSKDVLAVSLSYACYGYVAYIFFTWFFIYLSKVRGLDLKSSSYYGMLPFIGMATCSPLGGWISDRLTRARGKRIGRCGVAIFGIALSGIFIALGTQVADARLASVVLAGGAGALYLSQSVFWSMTADLGGSSAGSVSGIMNMANQLAGTLTASLTPYIASHFGWTASFLTAAAVSGVGCLAWLFVNPDNSLVSLPNVKTTSVD